MTLPHAYAACAGLVSIIIDTRIIPISESASHLAATLMEELSLRAGLQVADALIAATARERSEVLLTGNIRHFRAIPQLELKAFRLTTPGRG